MKVSSPNIPAKMTAANPPMTLLRVAALGAVGLAAWKIQDSHRKHREEKREEHHTLQSASTAPPPPIPYVPPFISGADYNYGFIPPVFIPPPIYFDPYPGFYGYY